MESLDIKETQLPPVDQLGYKDSDDDAAAQLALEFQNTLAIGTTFKSFFSRCPTCSHQSCRLLNKYGNKWWINQY